MKRLTLFILLSVVVIALMGCNLEEAKIKEPPVTENEAKEIAKDLYGITLINKIALIELDEDEIDEFLSDEEKGRTSLFYIIEGIDDLKEEVTVYINSDDKSIHFEKL